MARSDRLRIGISQCLLGDEVRHDGGHKRDPYLIGTVGRLVEWVPVCPEVEVGLGTPREPIRLVRDSGDANSVRLFSRSGTDLTKRMRRFSRARARSLAKERLSGFVLKKDSPSCGMERVKVWSDPAKGMSQRSGRGIFAAELLGEYRNLPVEEEGRLHDPVIRENFFERVFALERYRELGRLVANAKALERAELARRYEDEFMYAMKTNATPGRHTNVLLHAFGHFKRQLTSVSREELLDVIEDYRQRLVPRIVPLTLIRHHARTLEIAYLLDQVYLNPHPKELALLNHV